MQVIATDRSLLWAALRSGEVYLTDITPPGNTTAATELISAADENEFLGAVAGKATNYKPLPGMGERVDEGVYGWNNGLVIVRQSHTRQNNPDDAGVGALYGLYRPGEDVWEWVAGEALAVGARRSWEDVIYILYRDIGANNWFPPPQVPAHWEVWAEPGADAWVVGKLYTANVDVVTHNGHTWKCGFTHTSQVDWAPGTPGIWFWELIE